MTRAFDAREGRTPAGASSTTQEVSAKRVKGVEPSTFSLGSGSHSAETVANTGTYEGGTAAPHHTANYSTPKPAPEALDDPDLRALIAAWPTLPEAVRAGIAAMVRSTQGGER